MISFGSVFLELVFGQVQRLPGPGEEVFTDEFAVSCGGAVTSAGAAAAAGIRAGICTVLGDDLGSAVVQEFCVSRGVDLENSRRVTRRSAGITVVLNFAGDRAFITHKPPRPAGEPPEVEHWRAVLRRDRPRWCYLHGTDGVPQFLREARAQGTKTMLDVSLGDEEDKRDLVIECARLADLFVPNEAELQRLTCTASTELAVAAAAGWGTPIVVTRGAAGALIVDGDSVTEVRDGVCEVPVRDSTGAGDNFAGALIGALVSGASLPAAVVAANTAGSRSVGTLGAVGEVEVAGLGSVGEALGTVLTGTVFTGDPAAAAAVATALDATTGQQASEREMAD
jgi:sugar/nucleoside kinase (ribokinase family)